MIPEFNAKCPNGHLVRGTAADLKRDRSNPGRPFLVCPCGGREYARRMDIETTATRCGARCTDATSAKCHCECGGANHGLNRGALA